MFDKLSLPRLQALVDDLDGLRAETLGDEEACRFARHIAVRARIEIARRNQADDYGASDPIWRPVCGAWIVNEAHCKLPCGHEGVHVG